MQINLSDLDSEMLQESINAAANRDSKHWTFVKRETAHGIRGMPVLRGP